ncbi:MAG: saccharopine dehydrogenase family protein [Bacteroidia bacterium]
MKKYQIIVYGSYGYTGELIVEESLSKNLSILLSGRNEEKLKSQSEKTGYPYKAVDINNHAALIELLKEGEVLIHAAGPFINTARQMVEACIEAKTHYLDINGDITVFELIKTFDYKARYARIMLMPGVGFDVVPTDCMAVKLKNKMPDAISLKIAFATIGGGVSHGTATTVAGRLGEKSLRRIDGKLVPIAFGKNGMWLDFGQKRLFFMSIPWGDVSTAFVSTGIPNIESFISVPHKVFKFLKFQGLINWLLRTKAVRKFIQKKIDSKPAGPNFEERKNAYTLVWAEVKNQKGETLSTKLQTPEGYGLTATASLLITEKILSGNFKFGFQTPAMVYGEILIFEIEGVKEI